MGRRVGRFLLVCAAVAVIVVGIGLRNAALHRQAEVAEMAAAVEAGGYTLYPDAFEAAYHAGKPEPNAADVYVEALSRLEAGNADAAVELTIAAAGVERVRFPLRFRREAEIPFEFSLMRDLAGVITAELHAALEAGDAASARIMLDAQFALAESLNEAPLLILQAVRGALLHRAMDALAAVFASGELDGPWLAGIEASLEAIEMQPALVDALAAERAVAFASTVESAADRTAFGRAYDFVSGAQEALLRGVLSAYAEVIAAVEGPVQYRGAELERLSAMPASMSPHERMSTQAILMPVLRIAAVNAEHEGLLAAARGACVVERYRLAEGRLPDTVSDLATLGLALPDDPLGSGAIRYALLDDGYQTWSVGLDGLDDGGSAEADDIVFGVEARR